MLPPFDDADLIFVTFEDPISIEAQQIVASGGGGGGGTAIVDITSTTINVTAPTSDTRNIELPQALGAGASPTFNDITATGDLNAGDDLTVTDLATVGRLAVGGGTTINKIQSGTVGIDPPSIAAQQRGSVTFTVTGAAVGDIIIMQPPGALNAGLVFAGCEVTGANTVTVYLGNLTAGAIDDGVQTWRWMWIDIT